MTDKMSFRGGMEFKYTSYMCGKNNLDMFDCGNSVSLAKLALVSND